MVSIIFEQGPQSQVPVKPDPIDLLNINRDAFHIDTKTDRDNLVPTIGSQLAKLPFFPEKDEQPYVDKHFGCVQPFSAAKLGEQMEKIATDRELWVRMDAKRLRQKLLLRKHGYMPRPSEPVTSDNTSVKSEKSQFMAEGYQPMPKFPGCSSGSPVGEVFSGELYSPEGSDTQDDQHVGKKRRLSADKFEPRPETPCYLASLPAHISPAGYVRLCPATWHHDVHPHRVCCVGTTRGGFAKKSTTTDEKPPLPQTQKAGVPRAETVVPVPVPASGTPVSQDTLREPVKPPMAAPPADIMTPPITPTKNRSVPQQPSSTSPPSPTPGSSSNRRSGRRRSR